MLASSTSITTLAVLFASAFALSLVLVGVCRALAHRFGYVAPPRDDRWHVRPTALLGGVGISLTTFALSVPFGGIRPLAIILACGAGMSVLGLLDDLLSFKPATKLVAEIVAASVVLFFGYRLNWVPSLTVDAVLTLFWIVGLTNAFNLLDNMDGLCAGTALIVGTTLVLDLLPAPAGALAIAHARFLAILLGATAGFLVYNFNPASIFMGDSGSLFLGFSLATVTLGSTQSSAGKAHPLSIVLAPVLILLLPIFDTALVTVSRKLSGRRASVGGRDHSSHRLVAIGLSERGAVAVLWVLAATGGILGVALRRASGGTAAIIAALFVVGMVLFTVYLARIRVYDTAEGAPPKGITPVVTEFIYKRRLAEVLLDLCLIALAYVTAYHLRFEDPVQYGLNFEYFMQSLPLVLGVQILTLYVVGGYRGIWRYFSLPDAVVFGRAVIFGTIAAQLVILYVYRFENYSRAVFAVYGVLLFLMLTGSRASFRMIGEFLNRRRQAGSRVVIYGAGDGGALAVRELVGRVDDPVRIVGFIDDDPRKRAMRVGGYHVLGAYDHLKALVSDRQVEEVVVSVRVLDAHRLSELTALCAEHGVALSMLSVAVQQLVPMTVAPREGVRRRWPRAGAGQTMSILVLVAACIGIGTGRAVVRASPAIQREATLEGVTVSRTDRCRASTSPPRAR